MATKIQTNHDGEARCAHRDCYGNVCPTCFESTPFLQEVYGMVYDMTGAEYLDGETPSNVSPATPTVTIIDTENLTVGDKIIGFTGSARRPMVVKEMVTLPNGVGVVTSRGARHLITYSTVAVVR